jgi:hypothetical protein
MHECLSGTNRLLVAIGLFVRCGREGGETGRSSSSLEAHQALWFETNLSGIDLAGYLELR